VFAALFSQLILPQTSHHAATPLSRNLAIKAGTSPPQYKPPVVLTKAAQLAAVEARMLASTCVSF
jgi:hypothetical protein